MAVAKPTSFFIGIGAIGRATGVFEVPRTVVMTLSLG
jgi:hypothetical protein